MSKTVKPPAPPPETGAKTVGELQAFLDRVSPDRGRQTRLLVGVLLSVVGGLEALTTGSGGWPSLSAVVLMGVQPAAAADAPLEFWTEYRPGFAELLAVLFTVVTLAAGVWLMSTADAALWLPALRSRETRPGWLIALRVSGAIMLLDLTFRVMTLHGAGAHPLAFRLVAAAAGAVVLVHLAQRVGRLSLRHVTVFGSLVTAALAGVLYLVFTLGVAQVTGVGRHFPLEDGELKVLQLAGAVVSTGFLAVYAAYSSLAPVPTAAPGKGGRLDVAARRETPYRVTIIPHPIPTPWVIVGPNRVTDMPGVIGTIEPAAAGRLLAYRLDGDDPATAMFTYENPARIQLSEYSYLFIDILALPVQFGGEATLAPETQQLGWLTGTLKFSLRARPGVVPKSFAQRAWHAFEAVTAPIDEIKAEIAASLRRQFEVRAGVLANKDPGLTEVVLLRELGLAQADTYHTAPTDEGDPERTRKLMAIAEGMPTAHRALVLRCTALVQRYYQRQAIRNWLGAADAVGDVVTKLSADARVPLDLTTLDRIVRLPDDPASDVRGELSKLFGWLYVHTSETANQVRLSPAGREVLTLPYRQVRENLQATEQEFQTHVKQFNKQLDQVRGDAQATRDCLLAIAKTAAAGLFSPDNIPELLQQLGLSEFTSFVRGLVDGETAGELGAGPRPAEPAPRKRHPWFDALDLPDDADGQSATA